jgi:hypothetical protein
MTQVALIVSITGYADFVLFIRLKQGSSIDLRKLCYLSSYMFVHTTAPSGPESYYQDVITPRSCEVVALLMVNGSSVLLG